MDDCYIRRVDLSIREGLRHFLRTSMPMQPPGYRDGVNNVSDVDYRNGLYRLQSQILDDVIPPATPAGHWSVAPNMITSLVDITDDIYVVLPRGGADRSSVRQASILVLLCRAKPWRAPLIKHHGYRLVTGGKGSHVKLKKPGAPAIIMPRNRLVLSPGVVKQVLDAIGGYPISRLPDLLDGRLVARA